MTSSSSSTKTKAKKSTKEKKAANRDKNPATSNGQPEKRKKNDENEQLNNTIAAMSDDQVRSASVLRVGRRFERKLIYLLHYIRYECLYTSQCNQIY